MNTIKGMIYYTPQEDGSGEVNIITFSPRPEEEVLGMSVAIFDAAWLAEFMAEEPNIGQYRLVFTNDGTPEIDVFEPTIDTGRHEETFYHVEPYSNVGGVVLKSYPDRGTIKLRYWEQIATTLPMRNQRYQFFITKAMEPNVILKQFTATIDEILADPIVIRDLPLGEPSDAYSIWAVSPDTNIRVWWTV